MRTQPSSQPAIQVHNLVKSFGSSYALANISLEISAGDCVAIFGPNGAGKSTLLKILSSIAKPTSGEISINGYSLEKDPDKVRRHIGLIGHQTFLYDDLTAFENLFFYARLYDVHSPRDRAHEVLTEVGLSKRSQDRVRGFSRGMQQRLAIARAMLHDPEILFLDEPYTGLDQHAATMLTEWLQKLNSSNRTVLLVTHNLIQGLKMSNRVIIFQRGKIIWQDQTRHIDKTKFQTQYFELVAKGGNSI